MGKVNLLCFPHAGGGSLYYASWKKLFCGDILFKTVIYPGRESRIDERLPDTLKKLAGQLFNENKSFLEEDYAIWGHSMGSVVGYEVAKLSQKLLGKKPICYFASGAKAPLLIGRDIIHSDADNEFMTKLTRYGGIEKKLLETDEFSKYFIPVIKKDMELLYFYKDKDKQPLECPIYLFHGLEDDCSMEGWEPYTKNTLHAQFFTGSHFFIKEHQKELVEIMSNCIHEQLQFV